MAKGSNSKFQSPDTTPRQRVARFGPWKLEIGPCVFHPTGVFPCPEPTPILGSSKSSTGWPTTWSIRRNLRRRRARVVDDRRRAGTRVGRAVWQRAAACRNSPSVRWPSRTSSPSTATRIGFRTVVGPGHAYRAPKPGCSGPAGLVAGAGGSRPVRPVELAGAGSRRSSAGAIATARRSAVLRRFRRHDPRGSSSPSRSPRPAAANTIRAATFGIRTDAADVETVRGYCVDGAWIDAEWIQHRKANVDANVSAACRSITRSARTRRAERLLRNMSGRRDPVGDRHHPQARLRHAGSDRELRSKPGRRRPRGPGHGRTGYFAAMRPARSSTRSRAPITSSPRPRSTRDAT